MKKIKALGTLIIILAVLIPGCGLLKSCNERNKKVPPANIIVLLDLSDRVSNEKYEDSAKEQVKDDQKNYKAIIEVFRDIVRKEPYSRSQSKLRFFVPDQQGFPIDSVRKEKLRGFGVSPIKNTENFKNLKNEITATIDGLYIDVPTMPQEKFTGADIWTWFKDEANRYVDPESRNYIICFSDGYLDFNEEIQGTREKPGTRPKGTYMLIDDTLRQSDNWEEAVRNDEYKLIPAPGVNFSEYEIPVQFMLIGIKNRSPGGLLYEIDILKLSWKLWLKSMGIVPHDFFYPSDVGKEEIEAFLKAPNL